jgi:hypothetical protein
MLPFPFKHPTASRHVSLYEPHAETLSTSQFREESVKKETNWLEHEDVGNYHAFIDSC